MSEFKTGALQRVVLFIGVPERLWFLCILSKFGISLALNKEISSSVKACMFINNLNQERHGEFKRGLANSYASGADNYPKDVGEALSRAVNYLKIQPTKVAQQ